MKGKFSATCDFYINHSLRQLGLELSVWNTGKVWHKLLVFQYSILILHASIIWLHYSINLRIENKSRNCASDRKIGKLCSVGLRLAMLIYSGMNIMNLCVPNSRLLDCVLEWFVTHAQRGCKVKEASMGVP